MFAKMLIEIGRQLVFRVAEHRREVVKLRDVPDVVQSREHRELRELGDAGHEQEPDVARAVFHLRIQRRHPRPYGLGPGDVVEGVADGRIVFVDEDDDPLAPVLRIRVMVLPRLFGKLLNGAAEVQRVVQRVVVVVAGGDEASPDVCGEGFVKVFERFRGDVVELEMDDGMGPPAPIGLVDGEAAEELAPPLEEGLEG